MTSLDEQAAGALAFIRDTMARSASFTAVPGRGAIAMGVIGMAAAIVASRQTDGTMWLAIWLGAAAVAAPLGVVAMARKARAHGMPLLSPSGRRFAQGLVPSLLAAAVLTALFVRAGHADLLPAMWLLLYGTGVLGAATASVPLLTWIGAAFMACGAAAAMTPAHWGDVWMGLGFGGLQIIFGVSIARRYGG